MKKLDPKIIRVGDKVKIINPLVFVRCGYPLCKDDIRPNIIKNYGSIIRDLVYSVSRGDKFMMSDDKGKYPDETFIQIKSNKNELSVNYKIIEELTFIQLNSKNYGGTERSIHTELKEKYRGKLFSVIGIKYFKTGNYVNGYGGYSYDGEYDYSPPYLENGKTHKILLLNEFCDKKNAILRVMGDWLKIEACHVVKESQDQDDYVQDKDGNWIENPSKEKTDKNSC